MESDEIFISNNNGIYTIKANGRATFQCAPPLRNLAKTLETETFEGIIVDLKDCIWMDSTFMGILAMMGLRAKRINAYMKIANATQQNQSLLCGLGLKKLLQFVTLETSVEGGTAVAADTAANAARGNAETVLEAHKTLMNVDEQNVSKFEKVVDMVQKDIDRMNKQSGN